MRVFVLIFNVVILISLGTILAYSLGVNIEELSKDIILIGPEASLALDDISNAKSKALFGDLINTLIEMANLIPLAAKGIRGVCFLGMALSVVNLFYVMKK